MMISLSSSESSLSSSMFCKSMTFARRLREGGEAVLDEPEGEDDERVKSISLVPSRRIDTL